MAETKDSWQQDKDLDAVVLNVIGWSKTELTASAVAVLASWALIATMGLNYGIDFKGGAVYHYRFEKTVTEEQIRTLLEKSALAPELGEITVTKVLEQIKNEPAEAAPGQPAAPATTEVAAVPAAAPAQASFEGNEFLIKAEVSAEGTEHEDIEPKLGALFATTGRYEKFQRESIGPTVGKELRTKALWAIVISIVGMLLYISMRFEYAPAVASVLALVHDTSIVLGIFALFQREVTISILAAILTIIGYSINDSIVVLDRVRENNRLKARLPFDVRANLAINQTLMRTINTSLTTELAVIALLFFGGPVVFDFALAMTIGIVVGTYSSDCLVCPLYVQWYYWAHPGAQRGIEAA